MFQNFQHLFSGQKYILQQSNSILLFDLQLTNSDFGELFTMKEQVRNPSETDSIKSQISSKTSSEKNDSTKDAIKATTSDSQVNKLATCPSIPAAAFAFRFVLLLVVVWSGEPKQNQGRGLVDRKLVQAPPSPK